jgi:hypothetical protein
VRSFDRDVISIFRLDIEFPISDVSFDLSFSRIIKFASGRSEYLDSVVMVGIVRGADHDSRVGW